MPIISTTDCGGAATAVIPYNANGSRISIEAAIVLKRFKKNDKE